jgi:hypothetical protein
MKYYREAITFQPNRSCRILWEAFSSSHRVCSGSFELSHLLDLHSRNTCKVLGMTMMNKRSSVGTGVVHDLQIRLHAFRHRLHHQHGRRRVGRRPCARPVAGPVAIRELSLKET